jgi:hypothetical protein
MLSHSLTLVSRVTPERGEGGNNPITTLVKIQKVQRGQKAPHNGNTILPKNIQVAPFTLKGLINTILETRLTSRYEGIDGFVGRHPNLNNNDPSLLENIVGGVLCIEVHPTPFRPKEIKSETPKNIQWLLNKRKTPSVVVLNFGVLNFGGSSSLSTTRSPNKIKG